MEKAKANKTNHLLYDFQTFRALYHPIVPLYFPISITSYFISCQLQIFISHSIQTNKIGHTMPKYLY